MLNFSEIELELKKGDCKGGWLDIGFSPLKCLKSTCTTLFSPKHWEIFSFFFFDIEEKMIKDGIFFHVLYHLSNQTNVIRPFVRDSLWDKRDSLSDKPWLGLASIFHFLVHNDIILFQTMPKKGYILQYSF